MDYLNFRSKLIERGCFSTHQARSVDVNLQGNNLTRWIKKGFLVKLRQGYYAFSECGNSRDFMYYISNQIYRPSYVSLHTALAFYGVIPEAVVQINAVSTLKTENFTNDFGTFTYQKIKEPLFFGYDLKAFGDKTILFASPEKAILDLLYLYPFYDTPQELEELRFDEDFMHDELNVDLLLTYARRFESKALLSRVHLLLKTYSL